MATGVTTRAVVYGILLIALVQGVVAAPVYRVADPALWVILGAPTTLVARFSPAHNAHGKAASKCHAIEVAPLDAIRDM